MTTECLPFRMKGGAGRKSLTLMENKFRDLYEAVKEHKDVKSGRVLCTVFMKLPSKNVSFGGVRIFVWT